MKQNRILSRLGLGIALSCTLALSAQASSFTDIPGDYWATPYIEATVNAGLMGGTGDNGFSPMKTMSYGEFAVVICNGAYDGLKLSSATDTHWADPYLNLLFQKKLFTDDTGYYNLIEPYEGWQNDPIPREFVATLVANLMYNQGYEYGDWDVINQYSDLNLFGPLRESGQMQAVVDVIGAGIMSGSNGAFGVGQGFTRAEATVVIANVIEKNLLNSVFDLVDTVPTARILKDVFSYTEISYYYTVDNIGNTTDLNNFVSGDQFITVEGHDAGLLADVYNSNFELVDSGWMPNPLSKTGGFTVGSDGHYYAVYGQNNPDENDDLEVFRVVKYDSSFQEVGSFSINGKDCRTIFPFSGGNTELKEENGILVVHSCRTCYKSGDGLNHQMQFTIILNTEDMSLKNSLSSFQMNHVSHSFGQKVEFDGDRILLLDLGDANPRSIVMHYASRTNLIYKEVDLLDIPGTDGANATGVKLGSFEVGESSYFTAINRCDWDSVTSFGGSLVGLEKDERDIVLLVTDKVSLETREVRIDHYVGSGNSGGIPKLQVLPNGSVMVLWEEFNVDSKAFLGSYYVIVDGNGNITKEKTAIIGARLPDTGDMVVYNDQVTWISDNMKVRIAYQVAY